MIHRLLLLIVALFTTGTWAEPVRDKHVAAELIA